MGKLVAVMSIALVLPSMLPSPARVSGDRAESPPAEFSLPECEDCYECLPPNEDLVGYSPTTQPSPVTWAILHYCPQGWAGDCDEMFPCSPQQQQDAEDLQLAVQELDAHRVVDLLGRSHVVLAPERSAIQVMDCQGDHVAHQIFLEPSLLGTVVDLQEEQP